MLFIRRPFLFLVGFCAIASISWAIPRDEGAVHLNRPPPPNPVDKLASSYVDMNKAQHVRRGDWGKGKGHDHDHDYDRGHGHDRHNHKNDNHDHGHDDHNHGHDDNHNHEHSHSHVHEHIHEHIHGHDDHDHHHGPRY